MLEWIFGAPGQLRLQGGRPASQSSRSLALSGDLLGNSTREKWANRGSISFVTCTAKLSHSSNAALLHEPGIAIWDNRELLYLVIATRGTAQPRSSTIIDRGTSADDVQRRRGHKTSACS